MDFTKIKTPEPEIKIERLERLQEYAQEAGNDRHDDRACG